MSWKGSPHTKERAVGVGYSGLLGEGCRDALRSRLGLFPGGKEDQVRDPLNEKSDKS